MKSSRPLPAAFRRGPTGHEVTWVLPVIFKEPAAADSQNTYRIEVAASDDFGGEQGFAQVGTSTVGR